MKLEGGKEMFDTTSSAYLWAERLWDAIKDLLTGGAKRGDPRLIAQQNTLADLWGRIPRLPE
mgnify:CR=1 FL=1